MDVRLLEKTEIPQAKSLWKEAFGDSDAFIESYFANKILPGNSLGMFDGDLISVVHMIPYKICVQGMLLESAFIAGAATAKRKQGEGLMRTLLLESLRLMKKRGIVITHLYPFKHSFYEKFGWATYSYVHNKTASKATDRTDAEVVETKSWELLAPLYERMMRGYDGYVIREQREWLWRLEELWADGGKVVLLIKNTAPSAYMLYYNGEEKAEVIEIVYTCEEDIQPLLAYALKENKRAEYFTPAHKDASPYGMARIVDAEAFLRLFGAGDALKSIRVKDTFASWNNIGEGEEITIGDLAVIAHQGACLHDAQSRPESVCYSILKKVFLFRSTCIFEQY
jgi:predicted acetyltransferase